MKTISFYLVAVFFVFSLKGFSQIKVYEDNRVKIFGDKPTDDPYKDLSMQIYGSYGQYLANGRLGFGTYGLNASLFYARKVYVGELGTNFDSDRLELCGSNGIHFTYGQGYDYNDIIGKAVVDMEIINDILTMVPKFYFDTDVYSHGIILNSDRRFKENIEALQGSLDKLKLVRGVSYNLKTEGGDTNFISMDGWPVSGKEQNDLAQLAAIKEKLKQNKRERFGFVAQELKEIYPGLVEEDSDGYLHVDYLGLIPVLVESIKEQQKQLATLKSVLQTQ